MKDKMRENILRQAVVELNYTFPETLKLSGVLFYKGEHITQKEFKKLAREMK
jgi:hypothetical protein